MTVTATLHQLAADIELREQQLTARERNLATATELLNQSTAVQAAWRAGQQHERDRIITLISIQLDHLDRAGLNPISLRTLKRAIEEPSS